MLPRDEAREDLRNYMARQALTLGEIADRMGMARRSLLQFYSTARYGDGNGTQTAERIRRFIKDNPPEAPESPGLLHQTENVRIIDEVIAKVQRGRWGLIYGPPGTQKSFVFEYRMAEAWKKSLEPGVVWIHAQEAMCPQAMLQEIAFGVGAYAGISRHAILRSIIYTLRRRRKPVALIIDEAQKLMRRPDTLETLRDVGDLGKIGLLIAGHDDVEELFRPRRHNQFAQWRSRVEQIRRRLPGLSNGEAKKILRAELGQIPERAVESAINRSMERDIRHGKDYISARRLFLAVRDVKDGLEKSNGGARVN